MANQQRSTTKWVGGAAGGVGLMLLLWFAYFVWTKPPQMGADEEVFRTVDALYTAVTARNEKLLAQCEKKLQAHKDAGKLPGSASDYLDSVTATARAGRWQPAAERLYDFMKSQRREGAHKSK